MEIEILGCGAAFDPVHGNTSYLLRAGAVNLLVDCGYQTAVALLGDSEKLSAIDAIFLSHGHADHSFGIPVLIAHWAYDSDRTKPLTLLGAPGTKDYILSLAALAYPSAFERAQFPLEFLEFTEETDFRNLSLCLAPMEHGIQTFALAVSENGQSCAFSSDGRPSPTAVSMFSKCEHVFHDCYSALPTKKAHLSFDELLKLIPKLKKTKYLYLTHLAPKERAAITELQRAYRNDNISITVPGTGTKISTGA